MRGIWLGTRRPDEFFCQHRPDSDARGRSRQHTVVRMTRWLSPTGKEIRTGSAWLGVGAPTCGSSQLRLQPLTEISSTHPVPPVSSLPAMPLVATLTEAGHCCPAQSSGVARSGYLRPSIPHSLPSSLPPHLLCVMLASVLQMLMGCYGCILPAPLFSEKSARIKRRSSLFNDQTITLASWKRQG